MIRDQRCRAFAVCLVLGEFDIGLIDEDQDTLGDRLDKGP